MPDLPKLLLVACSAHLEPLRPQVSGQGRHGARRPLQYIVEGLALVAIEMRPHDLTGQP